MRTKSKTAVALFCFLLVTLSVGDAFVTVVSLFIPPVFAQASAKDGEPHWTQTLAQKNSPYPVMDSGVWAEWSGLPNMYWLDNQRVIFVGTETREKTRNREKLQIQIWDVKINKVTPYTEPAKSVHICYSDGFIDYSFEDDSKKKRRYAGNFGQEKLFVPPNTKNAARRWMDCEFHASQIPLEKLEGLKRHNLTLLLYRHGYLDYGPDSARPVPLGKNGDPILYYRTGQTEPTKLPITNETIRNIEYYQFKKAYFVHYFNGYQGSWWLYPDGRAEEVKFPTVLKLLMGGHFFPLRKDFFVSRGSSKIDTGKDPGDAGGYLLSEAGIRKLISGYMAAEVVSPDGCKIAFVNYPYIDATRLDNPARVTLKAINFCVGEEKQP